MDNPWETGEGDAWLERNREALHDPARIARDHTLALLDRSCLWPKRVLEIGCADGWRLDAIRRKMGATCFGSDVSEHAILEGMGRYPHLVLRRAASHAQQFPYPMDLVIIAFTLHWVDRGWLPWTISQANVQLMPGGHLIITDFLPDMPTKVRYHHRIDVELWTYKQDYSACFTALGGYREIDRIVFNHDDGSIGDCAPDVRAAAVLLRKQEAYTCA